MKRVLIVGCGYIGKALAQSYLEQGATVWALQRHPVALAGLQNILADISQPLEVALPAVDTIFYLVSADSPTPAAYQRAYVKGLTHLLQGLDKSLAPKIIYVSSTAVYAQQSGEWVDEASPTQPGHFSGQVLLEAENLLWTHSAMHQVVRLGGIYGPGRDKIIREVLQQSAQRVGRSIYTNRIHQQDCVGVLQHLEKIQTKLPLALAVDNEPVLYDEMLDWLASALGRPVPAIGNEIPERLLRSNKRCSNKLLRSTGYVFRYPTFRDGYRGLIEATSIR